MLRKTLAVVVLFVATAQPIDTDMLAFRMNQFAEHYNNFVIKVHAGIFDIDGAKRLSKLWHQIERSGMWPHPKKDK